MCNGQERMADRLFREHGEEVARVRTMREAMEFVREKAVGTMDERECIEVAAALLMLRVVAIQTI